MKLHHHLPAGTAAIWFGMAAISPGQITVNYDFTSGATVIENGQLSVGKTLGGLSGLSSITDVVTRLNLTSASTGDPMYLGDLYSSLTFGTSGETQRIAVLLNRPGRDDTSAFGSSLSALNVTLDDAATTNVWAASTGTGTYQTDGRLSVNPNTAGVAFAAGSNGLAALNGAPLTSNRVSLLVADYSQGGTATLASWGVSVTGAAASSGTFTPGANSSISDGTGTNNTVAAILNTTGASSGSLTLNLAGSTTFSNGVTGSAGITKTGAGTLVLGGTSNYSGATTVSNGTLLVNGGNTGSGAVNVTGGTLGGTGTVGGNTTVNTGAILAPGDAGVGKVGFSGDLTTGSGSIFEWELAATPAETGRGTSYDAVNVAGALGGSGAIFRVVLDGSQNFSESFWDTNRTWTDIFKTADAGSSVSFAANFSSVQYWNSTTGSLGTPTSQGAFTISGSSLTWTAVPEPSTALAGILLGSGLLRRRRRGRDSGLKIEDRR